jgi:thioredoxin 1
MVSRRVCLVFGASLLLAPIAPLQLAAGPPGRAVARASRAAAPLACTAKPAEQMRVKELKAELDQLGVAWKGVMFDKESLVAALVAARANPPPPAPPPPAPAEETSDAPAEADAAADAAASEAAPTTGVGDATTYEEAYARAYEESLQLRVKELRTALGERGIGWADLIEKHELAGRLAEALARASLFSRSGALTPGRVGVVDGVQLRQEMADDRTPMLVDVFATWCGPCKLIAPQLEALAAKYGDRLRIAKMDSDKEPQLSSELRVNGLPTLVLMRDAKEVHRFEGVPGNQDALDSLLKRYLGL